MEVIDKILNEWSFRCHDGIVDMNDPKKIAILNEILGEFGLLEQTIEDDILNAVIPLSDEEKQKVLGYINNKFIDLKGKEEQDKKVIEIENILKEKNIPEDICEYMALKASRLNQIPSLKVLINSQTLDGLGVEGNLKGKVGNLSWINNITTTQSSLSLGKGEILLTTMLDNAKLAKSSKYDIDYNGQQIEVKQSSISEKGIKSGGIISPLGRSSNYKNVWNKELFGGKSFKEKYFEKKERKEKGQIILKYPELSTWTPIYNRYFSINNKTEFLQDLNQVLNNNGFKGEITNSDFDKTNPEKFSKKIAFLAVGNYLNKKTLILLSSQLDYLILDEEKYRNEILNNPDIHANNAFLPRISYKEILPDLKDEETEYEISDEVEEKEKIEIEKKYLLSKEDKYIVKKEWIDSQKDIIKKQFIQSKSDSNLYELIPDANIEIKAK
jgi:hypothetical protein